MNEQESTRLLEETFGQQFDIQQFARFTKEFFNVIQIDIQDKSHYIASQYKQYIDKCWKMGQYEDSERKKMEVLAVKLKKAISRDRARTMQRNFVSMWLGKMDIDGAFVAFYGDDPEDWRFSFVKMEYSLVKDEDGKVKVAKELTPAKRYSYLVGVNEPNHTCRSQFLDIVIDEDTNPTMRDIEQAFSIDKVTKEFFEKYKDQVIDLRESIDKIIINDDNVRREFENKGITSIDFSKKLMGQIVFIYFLQKKGWLGVEKKTDGSFRKWGTGPKNFLQKLFKKEIVPYDNFFNEMLEPLFYEALSNDRSADNDFYSRFKCKIPFLNGGLFEPINDYDWTGTNIVIPNSVFNKIMDTFDRFNFTVKEDEPLEKEVAVDPEMLGKVFENLLEVKERKDKGAFYTPREIVHYMCQQSLINYLETNTELVSREDIEKFIHYGDVALDLSIKALAQKEIYNGKSYIDEKYLIPKFIADNYNNIDRLLQDIKIVDPAVGSGAFPIGMMNEIVKARSILSIYFSPEEKEKRTEYNLKRECIENNLYGVDIEPSAVEIAKLRFWLSLIVDEMDIRNIKPLPNLEHKIMCGNSLLEEFEGVNLFDERLLGEVKSKSPIEVEIQGINEEFSRLSAELSSVEFGTQSPELKERVEKLESLKKRKKALEKRFKMERKAKEKDPQVTMDEALQQRIRESQLKLRELNKLHKEFFNEQDRNKKKKLRKDIDKIEWKLIEATLKEQNHEEAMEKLKQYKRTNVKPFFLWKLYFAEVFLRENPGFDVVIGNPPYVQIQKMAGTKEQKDLENHGYETFARTGDIYCLFYERGNLVLRGKGTLTFITSNKWMRANYGKKLRKYLIRYTNPFVLIDFGNVKVFESATVNTNILILKKETNINITKACVITPERLRDMDIANFIDKYHNILDNLSEDSWLISSKKEFEIKKKIEDVATPLKKWNISINYGIKTGCNEAFIINGEKRKELIAKDSKSAEIIKPILRGRDIKRYRVNFEDLWIINTHNGYYDEEISKKVPPVNISQYPTIKEYLDSHLDKLEKRQDKGITPYNLRNCAYVKEFEREKIVWGNLALHSQFAIADAGLFINAPSPIINTGNKYLLAVLNSKLGDFYIRSLGVTRSGGYFEYKPMFIERFPVPQISHDKQQPFITLVDKITSITDDDDYLNNPEKRAKIKEMEMEIDKRVYELYGLTPEEIKIVDEVVEGKIM